MVRDGGRKTNATAAAALPGNSTAEGTDCQSRDRKGAAAGGGKCRSLTVAALAGSVRGATRFATAKERRFQTRGSLPPLAEPVAEEVVEVIDGVDLLDRRLDVVLDAAE